MPKTAAQTSAELAASHNPASNAARTVVNVTLLFEGVTFTPSALYTALDTAYGTVTSEKDSAARGSYIFKVAP